MDHPEAARTGAVERYLLGELQGQDREAFEEHFFDCPECAGEVRMGAVFQANARAALRGEGILAGRQPERRRPWFRWSFVPAAAMAACAALALVVGYQNLVLLPQLRHSTAEGAAFTVLPAAPASGVRAAADLSFSRQAGEFSLFVPHEWEEYYTAYTCELERRPGSKVLFTARIENGTGDFAVLVRTATLEAGKYVLNVYGVRADGQKTAVARFPLTLTD